MIEPPEGVPAFIKSFGTRAHLRNIASALGIELKGVHIQRWVRTGQVPDYVYQALRSVKPLMEVTATHGYIEFYYKGQFLGQFHMDKNISVIVRKRRD